MKTLDEQWDGATYYIKAEMAVDPKYLERRIAEVLNDKQKTKELEEARKRTLAAEAEIAKLKKELAAAKNEPQRLDLQTKYQQTADALSAEEYFTTATNAKENGFNELAIEYYQQAIDIDPNNAEAYYNMGFVYSRTDDYKKADPYYKKAIQYYKKVLELDPNDVKVYNNMGLAYRWLSDEKKAIQCFQKVIALDPTLANAAYVNMGNAYRSLKNFNEAIRCYQKALELDPNYAEAYYWMGGVYHGLKDNYHEAIRYYQKAVAIDQNYADAYFYMGIAYSQLGNEEEKTKNYQQAARLGNAMAQEWLRKMKKKW
jgi:superkiller protein 3